MFDSHCHLTDPRFADDLDEVLARAWSAGLQGLVTIASGASDADAAIVVAQRDSRMRATAGVHPHAAADATSDDLDRIRMLLDHPLVAAVGETGLDYHYDNAPRAVQRTLFEWHLNAAAETSLPIVVHCRSADADVAELIRRHTVRGVLHCFAGGQDLLDTALDAGWYVSFAGLATFRNFDNVELLRRVPVDRLLLETDSPYLAPVPFRGKRNEPAMVVETCSAVAAHRGVDPGILGALTTENARTFYRLPIAGADA